MTVMASDRTSEVTVNRGSTVFSFTFYSYNIKRFFPVFIDMFCGVLFSFSNKEKQRNIVYGWKMCFQRMSPKWKLSRQVI